MSAEVLRRAAALMRERAEVASGSPWSAKGDDLHTEVSIIALTTWHDVTDDARHIASWPPAVALAVADWLDSTANDVEHVHDPIYNLTSTTVARALTAARTYLGESNERGAP